MASTLQLQTFDRTVQLTAEAQVLRDVFRTLGPESCPQPYNFHMHTIHSDGQLRPEEVIDQALLLELKGFAITDHHSVAGYRSAQRYLQQVLSQHPGTYSTPHFWTGVEISADLLGVEVHILGFGFDPEHPALIPYLQGDTPVGQAYRAVETIGAIHTAGGIAVLAHPARYRCPAKTLIIAATELGIDGVETYYSYANPVPWQPSPKQTAEVYQLAQTYQLLSTCGTDTHGLSLLKRL